MQHGFSFMFKNIAVPMLLQSRRDYIFSDLNHNFYKMAVYFDHRLDTERSGINTDVSWFSGNPLLAVTSYSDETGGSVNLFLEEVKHISLMFFANFNSCILLLTSDDHYF